MDLGLSGLASNLDWRSLIDQLSEVERVPQRRLLSEQDVLQQRNQAYGSILTQLKVLQNRVTSLQSPDLFNRRVATTSDSAAATASASAGSIQGTFQFQFQQLATAARHHGATGAGKALASTPDVSGLVLGDAGFITPVTAGTFRVNGAEVTVATTDTLQGVFDKIQAATQGTVSASYDAVSDTVQLTSGSPIVLGSATDTSNFLQVAKLHNNGTGQVQSSGELGGLRLSATLDQANLAQALDYGATGTGQFKINGVSIEFRATDTLDAVLKRIHDSAAGVTATYDALQDRLVLANKSTGDVGIAMEDVSGNFLAATRLSAGSLERGKDLLYTVNGGGVLRSRSNTIQEASSGLAGLGITALKEGASATITVGSDTSAVRTAITDFIDAYNKAQSLIESQTASSTDADGKVTTKTLAAENDADAIASSLRRLAYAPLQGGGFDLRHLESLGIKSNSDNNTLSLADPAKLDEALATRMASVRDLWTAPGEGVATRLAEYLEKTAGEDGTLAAKQDLLTRQASAIDGQIADLERIVQANRARMVDSFVAMEKAQANINQQMQFLLQRFGGS